jgi:hypothetical protein
MIHLFSLIMTSLSLISVFDTSMSEAFACNDVIPTRVVTLLSTSSSLNLARMDARKVNPGSELFPGKGPYVPSGLSIEEYSRLKMKEEENRKKMNFGAWGPRFKRSDAPDGDWMVMPALWTNGFNARRQRVADDSSKKSMVSTFLAETASFLREIFPALFLAIILLETLATVFVVGRTSNLMAKQAALALLRPESWNGGLSTAGVMKTLALKLSLSAAMIPAMTRLLETLNRRRLWSRKRTISTAMAASIVSLVGLAFVPRLIALAASCVR